ncbi:MAG: 2'-5' RNA ligase family protein [Planctomycetota bacterium]
MTTKTYNTALVLTPPESVWGPIQEIRRAHDRHFGRWMPHITLLYPFRPCELFDEAAAQLAPVCAAILPFSLTLAEFRHFRHGRSSYTVWLAPEPNEPVIRLQQALMAVLPDCDDVARHAHGVTPHLSVGQCRGSEALREWQQTLAASWRPLSLIVHGINFIRRGDLPDDVFRVDRHLPLGA